MNNGLLNLLAFGNGGMQGQQSAAAVAAAAAAKQAEAQQKMQNDMAERDLKWRIAVLDSQKDKSTSKKDISGDTNPIDPSTDDVIPLGSSPYPPSADPNSTVIPTIGVLPNGVNSYAGMNDTLLLYGNRFPNQS